MKKLLLLISVMLVSAGFITAQDVYSAGFYTDSNVQYAAVYKNGQRLHYTGGGTDYKHSSQAVVCKDNKVYWVDNSVNASSSAYYYGDVFENGTRWLSNPSGNGSHINDLFVSPSYVWSVGCLNVDGVKTAAIWQGNTSTPFRTFGAGEATCGFYLNNYCQIGGYVTSGSTTVGKVWNGSNELYTYDNGTRVLDMMYYNGAYYCVGSKIEGSDTKLVVWRNNSLLYTLVNTNASFRARIWVDAGDIYVASYANGPDKVWKNEEEISSTNGWFHAVVANTDGVYYAGGIGSAGKIWKDGTVLYTPSNCNRLYDMYIEEPTCTNSDVRTLPYTESFENGATDWQCWTKIDSGDNGSYASFWDRTGKRVMETIPDGDYCAGHQYGPSGVAQTGWLISPKLFLQPGRDYTTLTFKSCETSSGTTSMKVLVSTTTTNTSAFTEVYSLTDQTSSWKTINVNLKAYQGQAIYIAFKYEGTYAKNWYIDDIEVTETWQLPMVETAPYTMDFTITDPDEVEPGYRWYVIDLDHSGGKKCWQYNESEQCAYHPYGQQNTPQQGAMFTPRINLPSGYNYSLSFRTKTTSTGDNMAEKVGIIVDPSATIPDYNAVTWIWQETSYSTSWVTKTIDLTSYAGHTVYICFWYEGTYARNWYVDDVEVTNALPQYNINVVANNPSWGTVTGGNVYDQGATATITATPNAGYDFLKWTKDGSDVSTNATYSFTVTENATYTAVFGEQAVTYYTITTAVTPEGAGTVTGGNTYEAGATATLAASANTGWEFTQWQDGNTSNPRTITVTGDATYTAQFSQINYTISVSAIPAEGGTVTGGGTNYHYGQSVELTATPNAGYDFINWNDGETSPTRTIVVDGDAGFVAYFAEQGATTYEITVLSDNLELGTVEGGGVFPEGAVITISAHPIGFAQFVRWSDGSTRASREITVTGDATYTAFFEMATMYTINVVSANPDMGTASGGGEFPSGAEIIISATPFGGYHFNGWDDNNYENPRTVIVTGNATYRATFSSQQQETYHVTVMCNTNEGSVIGTGDYPAGTVVMIAAIPNAGYRFKEWNDGNTQNPRSITVNGDIIYFATFIGDAVDENDAQAITLYPNPANDVIRLQGLGENTEVRIYNVLGELVKVVNVSDNEEIRVNDLSAGLYIVRSGNAVLKFTKE